MGQEGVGERNPDSARGRCHEAMPRRPPRARVLVAGLALATAACSGSAETDARPPDPSTPLPARPSSTPVSTTAPVVLAAHPTRPRLDLPEALARRVLRGEVEDWRDLGGSPGGLRVVAAPGTPTAGTLRVADAGTALAAVRADPGTLAVVPAAAVGPAVSVLRVGGRHPLREPSAYPIQAPGPAPPHVTTATVVGDVMLARRVGDRMARTGDWSGPLRPTARRLAAADLTLGNLEGTLDRSGPPRQGNDSFGADPRVREGLRLAGFDVLSLANNHVGDYGTASILATVRRVAAAGISPVGAGADRREAARPVVVERGGLRFGIVAFDAIGETPAAGQGRPGVLRVRMQPRTGPLNRADLRRVTALVRDLRSKVDVVLVLPHWGTQYTTRTVRDQRVVARAMVEAGADVVIGGHPHWLQGVELHRGGLIAYSLGNYVFDMDFSRETQQGAFVELTFWGDVLKGAEFVPVRIGPDFAPRVAGSAPGRAILDRAWDASGRPLAGSHVTPAS